MDNPPRTKYSKLKQQKLFLKLSPKLKSRFNRSKTPNTLKSGADKFFLI